MKKYHNKNVSKIDANYQLIKIIHMVDLDAERAVNRQPDYRTRTRRADMIAEP